MGTASAEPEKLATFVTAADALLNEGDSGTLGLNRRIGALRASYDDFQATDSLPVRNVDLMGVSAAAGGEVERYAANLERDRLFVEAVRRAFVEAGGSSTGLVSVDQTAFDRALGDAVNEMALEHDINPADLLILRDEITVDDPFVAGVPQSSGYVNDPICRATGHFVEVEEDFTWPERLAVLRWRRVYSSRFVAAGPFGRGWASWAGVGCARRSDGSVGFQGPDGQFVVFAPDPSGTGYGRAPGVAARLTRLPGVGADGDARSGDGEAPGGWELAWDWRSPWPGQRWRFGASGRIEQAAGGEIVLSAPDTIAVSGPEGNGSLELPGLEHSDSVEVWCGEGWCLLVGLQHPAVVAARPADGEVTVLGDVERLDLEGGYYPGGLERVEFHELPGGDVLVVTELSVARVSSPPTPAIVWQRTHDDLTARVQRIDDGAVWFDADGDRFGFDLDDGTDILR